MLSRDGHAQLQILFFRRHLRESSAIRRGLIDRFARSEDGDNQTGSIFALCLRAVGKIEQIEPGFLLEEQSQYHDPEDEDDYGGEKWRMQ